MKSILLLLALTITSSSFAQWTHEGEDNSGISCSGIYHSIDLPECADYWKERRKEMDREYKLKVAKQQLMESDPHYLEMLSSFKGCKSVDVNSKKLEKMNQAELCRRQLMDRLEKGGYFEELEANFNQ